MELPTLQLPFGIPLSGAVRVSVLEQVLQGMSFSMQQVPKQIHEMRAWATETAKAEEEYLQARGRRAPRSLARRKGLEFISKYDALLKSLKEEVAPTHIIHSAIVILGPNYHNPKLALYMDFDDENNDEQQHLGEEAPTPTVGSRPILSLPGLDGCSGPPIRYTPSLIQAYLTTHDIGMSRRREVMSLATTTTSTTTTTTNNTFSSSITEGRLSGAPHVWAYPRISSEHECAEYAAPLPTQLAPAVARKSARLLVIEAANVYGLQSFGPNKLIVLVRVTALPVSASASASASASSANAATIEGASTMTISSSTEAVITTPILIREMPHGWAIRPNFSLKPPRRHAVRTTVIINTIANRQSVVVVGSKGHTNEGRGVGREDLETDGDHHYQNGSTSEYDTTTEMDEKTTENENDDDDEKRQSSSRSHHRHDQFSSPTDKSKIPRYGNADVGGAGGGDDGSLSLNQFPCKKRVVKWGNQKYRLVVMNVTHERSVVAGDKKNDGSSSKEEEGEEEEVENSTTNPKAASSSHSLPLPLEGGQWYQYIPGPCGFKSNVPPPPRVPPPLGKGGKQINKF